MLLLFFVLQYLQQQQQQKERKKETEANGFLLFIVFVIKFQIYYRKTIRISMSSRWKYKHAIAFIFSKNEKSCFK